MATQVSVTTTVSGSNWIIQASVLDPAEFPKDIFLYENSGTTALGDYFGVANLQDYSRMQTWTGVEIPVFGNKYVKSDSANIIISIDKDPTSIVNKLKKDIANFKAEYLATGSVSEVFSV